MEHWSTGGDERVERNGDLVIGACIGIIGGNHRPVMGARG